MSSLQVLPHRQRAFGVWCAQRAWRRGRVAPAHVLVARCRAGVAQGLVQPASAQGGLHLRPLHPAERARFGLRRHRAAAGLLPAHLDAEPSRQAARPARHDAGPVAPAGRRRAHDTAYASRARTPQPRRPKIDLPLSHVQAALWTGVFARFNESYRLPGAAQWPELRVHRIAADAGPLSKVRARARARARVRVRVP